MNCIWHTLQYSGNIPSEVTQELECDKNSDWMLQEFQKIISYESQLEFWMKNEF